MALHGRDVMCSLQPIIDENAPQIWEVKEQVMEITNLFSFLHCYHQRKIRWLERDLNSHLRVSRPPLYPLSYRVIGDWWRVLSNLSGRNIFATA